MKSIGVIPAVMLLETFQFPTYSLWRALFLLGLLTVGYGDVKKNCTNRRCLAEMLINKDYVSQPQSEDCIQKIYVPFMEYQTLAVDTKNLRLLSRLQVTMIWNDPELMWDTSIYNYDRVVLPVQKIWTPEIHVTNGIVTTMQHSSRDLLVFSNGTLRHSVIINTQVNCEVNLFNYPFAADECPVAIHTWAGDGCGTELELGQLKLVDGAHGDWKTDNVHFEKQSSDRNYITVELSIKYINPFITLMLPSYLLLLADMVSFSLPLGGGERNSFKVTLVLSFTMFLIILNDKLPGDSQCSPIIRSHFCICLVLLVVSMLVSLVLTRVAKDGRLIFCCSRAKPRKPRNKAKKEDEEAKADISVIQTNGPEEEKHMLKKVVNFLEAFEAKEEECERHQKIADAVDKTFFWLYFSLGVLYCCVISYVIVKQPCEVNHFDFWY